MDSSRYGRYVEYQFDDAGKLVGAKLLSYMLEKSRAAATPDDERNFHVFYQLLAGASAEERTTLRLSDASHFAYLTGPRRGGSGTSAAATARDAAAFNTFRDNLKSLGVGRRQQAGLIQTLAAILHLGNVTFFDDPNKPGEACEVKNPDVLAFVSSLLGVLPANLEYALTYRTRLIRRELCTVYLSAADAARQRDSLASSLYSLAFHWFVEHLNSRLDREDCATFIGVVDLSGFQDHRANKFEQLLFNYSNERLQSFSMRRLFVERGEEYDFEGIPRAANIKFPDNSGSLQLLRDGEPNLLAILNDESKAAAGGARDLDARVVDALNSRLASNPAFVAAKKGVAAFGIRHYAGLVDYDAAGLVDKNTDTLSVDFVSLFRGNGSDMPPSSNIFVRTLFTGDSLETEQHPRDGRVVASAQVAKMPLRHPSMKRRKRTSAVGAPGGGTLHSTAAEPLTTEALESSLNEMFEALSETVPWFVFCVKPNEDLVDSDFDARTVKGQVGHLGLVPAANDRAVADYTASYLFDDFKTRYRVIVEPMRLEGAAARGGKFLCREFVSASKWTAREMAVGSTRVFLSEESWRALEDELRTIELALKEERKARKRAVGGGGGSVRSGSRRGAGDELESVMSDDPSAFFAEADSRYGDGEASEVESHYGSEFRYAAPVAARGLPPPEDDDLPVASGDIEMGRVGTLESKKAAADSGKADGTLSRGDTAGRSHRKKQRSSPARRRWLCMTWCLTWWIPDFCLSICGKMKRPDIRIAWREKVALCIIILLMNLVVLFFIIVFGQLLCPSEAVYSASELSGYTGYDDPLVSAYGRVFNVKNIMQSHDGTGSSTSTASSDGYGMLSYQWDTYLGTDVSTYFYKMPYFSTYCPGLSQPQDGWDNLPGSRPSINSSSSIYPYHHAIVPSTGQYRLYLEYMNQFAVGRIGWTLSYIASKATPTTKLIVLFDNVYDVSAYSSANNNFLGPNVLTLFGYYGQDATSQWAKIQAAEGKETAAKYLSCMNNLFYVGTVDHRADFRCQFSNYILLAATVVIVLIIGVKFIAALQLTSKKDPEDHDKFVICQIPCYTEGPESLTRTLESLALLRYDDKRKLLLVIADGMIIGSGNDRPTPRIVLDILGVDPMVDPEPLAFQSVGDGDKQLNYGKVYSGLYEVQGRTVPFIVVVKVGKASERARPGNRGKRDSQLILMRFLSKVHFNGEMSPLELELYHHMKNIIGVNPSFYEYVLMVDADTEVFPDSLNRMVSCMIHDSRIAGICGETMISNERDSWITMIQ
ncbi:hypothetical protein HK405_007463, partial [Cladochytrium tenue]